VSAGESRPRGPQASPRFAMQPDGSTQQWRACPCLRSVNPKIPMPFKRLPARCSVCLSCYSVHLHNPPPPPPSGSSDKKPKLKALIPVSCCCRCCGAEASSTSPNNNFSNETCGGWLQTNKVEEAQFQTNFCQAPGNVCDVDGAQLPHRPVTDGTPKLCPLLAIKQGPGLLPPHQMRLNTLVAGPGLEIQGAFLGLPSSPSAVVSPVATPAFVAMCVSRPTRPPDPALHVRLQPKL
jgi:hypothetical protein